MNLADLRHDLATATTGELASELLAAYDEVKSRYYKRDFRPGELEGGRFAEAAFRILQLRATGKYTRVGTRLPAVTDLLATLERADAGATHESVRIHIPRALASVHNVRNRRDVGHIASDVDANAMDAEYVVATCSWVLAELVRLFHGCSPEQAQAYVDAIVRRRAPLVQVLNDVPFVLRSDLAAKEEILILLYHQGTLGASLSELDAWLPTLDRKVIGVRIGELERDFRYVRRIEGRAYITDAGIAFVESTLLPPT